MVRATVALCLAAFVRGSLRLRLSQHAVETEVPTDEVHKARLDGIKEKYGDYSQVSAALFEIACVHTHRADIMGKGREKARASRIEEAQFVKNEQAAAVQRMREGCGIVESEHEQACRAGCGQRWGDQQKSRGACDGKCEDTYARFREGCRGKVADLENVMIAELKNQGGTDDITVEFCQALWTLLEDSSAVDPATGDPAGF